MLAERYVLLKNIAVSRSSCVQEHYLLTVDTYFFVSTILKVPTEFSFGIGMLKGVGLPIARRDCLTLV